MATGQNLGHATYTLTANTQPFTKGMQAVHKESQQAGRGLLQLGYAIDDLQYGFKSIVNNIPQIALGLGAGAGVAGAAAIAAVAISQLVNHWGELTSMMQAAWSGSTVEQLERVRKGAEDAAAAFDKMAKAPTKAGAAQTKAIEESTIAGPIGKVMEGALHAVLNDPTLRKEAELAYDPETGVVKHKSTETFQREAAAANRKIAEGIVGGAAKGNPRDLATLKRLVKQNPEGFPAGYGSDLEAASPEGQKRQADFEKQVAVRKQVQAQIKAATEKKNAEEEGQAKRRGEIVKEAADKAKKEADDLARDQAKIDAANERRATKETSAKKRMAEIYDRPFYREQSQFMGAADFSKSIQTGALNNTNKIQEEQLKRLVEIKEILKENGMKNFRDIAVAGK